MMEEVRAINPFASFGETRSTKKLSKKQRKEVRKNKRAEKARMEKEEEEEEAAAARLKQTEDAARNNTALHQRNFTLEEKVSVHSAALETVRAQQLASEAITRCLEDTITKEKNCCRIPPQSLTPTSKRPHPSRASLNPRFMVPKISPKKAKRKPWSLYCSQGSTPSVEWLRTRLR